MGGRLFFNNPLLSISRPTCIKHGALFHAVASRVKQWNEMMNDLTGNLVMLAPAFGHLTAPCCKMWHFNFSYLCLDRIWCIWDYISSDTRRAANLCMFLNICAPRTHWSFLAFVLLSICFDRVNQPDLEGWAPGLICLLNRDCFFSNLLPNGLLCKWVTVGPESHTPHCIKHLTPKRWSYLRWKRRDKQIHIHYSLPCRAMEPLCMCNTGM